MSVPSRAFPKVHRAGSLAGLQPLSYHIQNLVQVGLLGMHQCLRTPELLSHILEDVYAEESGLKDMAALAVACQTFREPALDILWRSLPSLGPLLRCLPEDAYTIVHRFDGAITMVSKGSSLAFYID